MVPHQDHLHPSEPSNEPSAPVETLLATLRQEGVHDQRVLQAIRDVPRAQFVIPELRAHAFENIALPIEQGQTISQPLMVAVMTQALALNGSEHVLEIGTGSGYQAAVLARCARSVVSVERWPLLAEHASRRLKSLGYTTVEVHTGDGTLGWPPSAPYDAILVAAAAPEVPPPLLEQLREGGRMVIPIGNPQQQELTLLIKKRPRIERHHLGACVFVPLIGWAAWHEAHH
ncbi:MAG TPA: protein-L-isoaspartate(D-aspartate) O-methyltransferase [Ktedonobacterales bacterium]|jgi:protein-L-isoaspartate(D-aspartate) O-methyltransferase